VGKVVDELVRGIASRTGTMDSSRATLLACLHLADQLRAAEKQLEEIRARVASKHEQFRALLDQAVEA
jgi:cell division protein ZapA (FtsZ GTPase activity inhibitor)